MISYLQRLKHVLACEQTGAELIQMQVVLGKKKQAGLYLVVYLLSAGH